MAALDQRIQLRYHYPAPALTAAEAGVLQGTSAPTWRWPAGPTPSSPTTRSAPSTATPAGCPAPSTGSPSPPCSPPTPQDHRRRILRPHRHHRGGRDRLTATTTPRPPKPRPAPARRGFPHQPMATVNATRMDILSVREQPAPRADRTSPRTRHHRADPRRLRHQRPTRSRRLKLVTKSRERNTKKSYAPPGTSPGRSGPCGAVRRMS